jgi:GNAT superfamily N-acetyltransferase
MTARVAIRDDRIDGAIAGALVSAMLDELEHRYGFPDPDAPDPDELAPPHGLFLVAYVDHDAVGCGGVRRHADGVGEVKRMYVRPAERRRGVARALLRELHRRAAALGYARLVLETGVLQPEAIALYESEGYVAIPPYGLYAELGTSRCFAVDLPDQGTSS